MGNAANRNISFCWYSNTVSVEVEVGGANKAKKQGLSEGPQLICAPETPSVLIQPW